MNQKLSFAMIFFCAFMGSLLLNSCIESPSIAPSRAPTLSQTLPTTRTDIPFMTAAVTATPVQNSKTVILTPDDLFALPELKKWSTPESEDFCEHLPIPQILATSNRLSVLSGRFVLCPWESWPWVTNTTMDLDTGSFVSKDDIGGDIVMQSAPWSQAGEPSYGVVGKNNAYISDAYVLETNANHSGANHLSYEYCENLLRDTNRPSSIFVEEGKIACVRTTEGSLALIRVEKIYPPATLSVEFSFTILRKE